MAQFFGCTLGIFLIPGGDPINDFDLSEHILTTCYAEAWEMNIYFGIQMAELRKLVLHYSACGLAGDKFYFDPELATIIRLWMKAGDAYKELGFNYFVTAMLNIPARREK